MPDEMVAEWLEISLKNGKGLCAQPACINSIDAAVERWISSNYTRDTILALVGWIGEDISVLASTIDGWMLSTPATRTREAYQIYRCELEDSEIRATLGLWDGKDDSRDE